MTLSARHSQYQKYSNIYKNTNFETRIAKYTDILSLVNICRNCFPDKAIWQAPRFYAIKMWEAILSWSNNETWICSLDGRVSGFIVLVMDHASFNKEWREQRKNFLFAKILIVILSPKFVLNIIWKKTLAYLRRFKTDKNNLNISELQNKNRLWIAILAVSPKMRRQGVAKVMITHALKRAIDFGKEAATLMVDIRNRPARWLYEKSGFTYKGSDLNYCYYEINLNRKAHKNVAS